MSPLQLRYGARSDVGLLREENEDAMYAGPRLLAVADGMGGHAAGEVASRVVIETVAALDRQPPDGDPSQALRSAVVNANEHLRAMSAADRALEGMGTTLTALLWTNDELRLVHIGDSRGYLFRDGELLPVTHDHTFVQNLIDEGRISADEALTHPQRSWITNALDGRPSIELDLSAPEARAGDRYLICSDGLSSYVSEQTIAETLRTPDPQAACDFLVDLALRAGGPDNITCIVGDFVEVEGSAAPIVGGAATESLQSDGSGPASEASVDATAAVAAPAEAPRPPTAPPTAAGNTSTTRPAAAPRDADTPAAPAPSGTGTRRLVIVLGLVLLLVAAGIVGTFFYVRTQYYVGADAATGTSTTVAVYRGVSGSILGVDLSRLSTRTDLPISALPNFERAKVDAGIQASSRSDADRIVSNLRQEACANATPTPAPSPSATPATARKGTTRRHRAARPAAKPTPTPTPALPSYCAGSS